MASCEYVASSEGVGDYEHFLDTVFTMDVRIEDPQAEMVSSSRYSAQGEECYFLEDRTITNLSLAEPIDSVDDNAYTDTIMKECGRVVEIPSIPDLDSSGDQLNILPSKSTFGIRSSSVGEHWTIPSYDQNSHLRSFMPTRMGQFGIINSCNSFDHQVPHVYPSMEEQPEPRNCVIQTESHPPGPLLSNNIILPVGREILADSENCRSRHPDSNLMEGQEPSPTLNNPMNSQHYRKVFGGYILDAGASSDQSLPFEYQVGYSNLYHPLEGAIQTKSMHTVPYDRSMYIGTSPTQAVEQPHTSGMCVSLETFTSQSSMSAPILPHSVESASTIPLGIVQNPYTTSAIDETYYQGESSGTNDRNSPPINYVGCTNATTASNVGDLLQATSGSTASATSLLEHQSTQSTIEYGRDSFSHGTDQANILQTFTDLEASALQNYPNMLCQHSKPVAARSSQQLAQRPNIDLSGTVHTRRDISGASGNHSNGIPQSYQRRSTELFQEYAHKVPSSSQTKPQKDSKGLVRRRFRKHERIKMAKVREIGSCMLCRQQKVTVSTPNQYRTVLEASTEFLRVF